MHKFTLSSSLFTTVVSNNHFISSKCFTFVSETGLVILEAKKLALGLVAEIMELVHSILSAIARVLFTRTVNQEFQAG